ACSPGAFRSWSDGRVPPQAGERRHRWFDPGTRLPEQHETRLSLLFRAHYARAMKQHHFLRGARVYLSGPMDFVASRADEKKLGWRNRIGDFLRAHGAIV